MKLILAAAQFRVEHVVNCRTPLNRRLQCVEKSVRFFMVAELGRPSFVTRLSLGFVQGPACESFPADLVVWGHRCVAAFGLAQSHGCQ